MYVAMQVEVILPAPSMSCLSSKKQVNTFQVFELSQQTVQIATSRWSVLQDPRLLEYFFQVSILSAQLYNFL